MYSTIFDDEACGTPDRPSGIGVLKLASLGAVEWNRWRSAQPSAAIDLRDIDWTSATARFADCDFGDGTTFDGAVFGSGISFAGARFGANPSFRGAKFLGGGNFAKAEFRSTVNFSGTDWTSADFSGAKLDSIILYASRFQGRANFSGMQYGHTFSAEASIFVEGLDIVGSFGGSLDFKYCQILNHIRLSGSCFLRYVDFRADTSDTGFTQFLSSVSLRNHPASGSSWSVELAGFSKERALSSRTLPGIQADGVFFGTSVVFSGREFTDTLDFGPLRDDNPIFRPGTLRGPGDWIAEGEQEVIPGTRTTFCRPPKFFGCKLYPESYFDQVLFLDFESTHAAASYRALRRAVGDINNNRDEQLFFRLELRAESRQSRGIEGVLHKVYWMTSNYGSSVSRPILWWSGILLFSLGAYSTLLASSECWIWQASCQMDASFAARLIVYAIGNSVPLPGMDANQHILQKIPFGEDAALRINIVQILAIVQKASSVVFLFLAALGLRNLFRIRN